MGEGEQLRIKATMYSISKSLEKKGHEDQTMHNMEKKMILCSTGKEKNMREILEVLLVMRRISFVYKYKL
jgi:hypothetical protein